MPPPPIPFFRGQTLRASEKNGLLAFAPVNGHALSSPPATSELYLPAARLIRVEVAPLAERAGWAALHFHGEFSRVSRPEDVTLAPLTSDDAAALAAALTARLGLPRRPKPIQPHELDPTASPQLELDVYVTVIGTHALGHFEAAEFKGCKLAGDAGRLAGRIAGTRYRITGFYEPARPEDTIELGYARARLHVVSLQPEPDGPPRTDRIS